MPLTGLTNILPAFLPSAIVYLVSCIIFSDSLNFNAHGGFGTWAWAVSYHPGDLEEGIG